MSLTSEDVKKIAHLARLNFTDIDSVFYTQQLSSILNFIEQLNQIDTSQVEPLAHPLNISQRLRPDIITEPNLRDKFQQIAPKWKLDFISYLK